MLQPDLDGTFPGGRVSALSVTLSQDESMSEQEQGSDASEVRISWKIWHT